MSDAHQSGRFAEVIGVDQVRSAADAARIVDQMRDDLRRHPTEWENGTLERFLEALSASLDALPSLYTNKGGILPDPPTWQVFAEAVVMASGYE